MSAFQRCPQCGSSVKVENLLRHLRRVHPGAATPDPTWMPPQPRRELTPLERRVRGRTLATVLLLALIVVLGVTLYGLSVHVPAGGLAHLEVAPSSHDFGEIAPDVVQASFTLRNGGDADLTLLAVATSCMCTSATVRVRGRDSPVFGAHGSPPWTETLAPGESATLTVAYDPNVHPDSGPVVRAVYIKSNDPESPEVQVLLTAYVVRG